MFRAYIFKRFGELLMSFLRAAALPAALSTSWYATYALAQEVQKTDTTAASSSALVANEAQVPDLPANLERLPAPSIAPPVNRKNPTRVRVELEARPVTGLLSEGIGYHYWTYNGTVPGPMIRVRQGDTVELSLHNALDSPVTHSIDSHGVLGPGGGGKVTQTAPGATSVFQFKAMRPGVFIYHCATPMIPYCPSSEFLGQAAA